MIPAMTDRGLPIVDGAPACPFVAFEDDRDGRALAPDHRHRCFAEPRPAPRALAHQEAYCLSSAFPVCPTFQDWARREAAAARPAPAEDRPIPDEPPVSRPMPPLEREDRHLTDTPDPVPPRRNAQRDWAAPPPWSGEGPPPGTPGGPAAMGAAGVAAQPPESRGLAGSAADRLAGPDAEGPEARPARQLEHDDIDTNHGAHDDADDSGGVAQDDLGPVPGEEARYARPSAAAGLGAAASQASPQTSPASTRQPVRADQRPPAPNPHDQVHRRDPKEASDLFGPAWERPQRYEAYPSLQQRIGLPGVAGLGRIGVAALGLALAALLLFFVGPTLLGIGTGDDDDPGAGATATPVVEATPTPLPTEPPAPTPQVYVVARGDTISKIAAKFDVTVEQLLAANPQITDPNKIDIGDPVTVPVPVSGGDDGEVEGEASPEP